MYASASCFWRTFAASTIATPQPRRCLVLLVEMPRACSPELGTVRLRLGHRILDAIPAARANFRPGEGRQEMCRVEIALAIQGDEQNVRGPAASTFRNFTSERGTPAC